MKIVGLIILRPQQLAGPCEELRIIQPLEALKALGHDTETYVIDIDEQGRFDLGPYIVGADVVVIQRSNFIHGSTLRRLAEVLHSRGAILVYDLDDLIPHDARQQIVSMIQAADLVTTTTKVIKEQVSKYNKNVVILPNCFDPDRWTLPADHKRQHRGLTVGFQGSPGHDADARLLASIFVQLHRRYPEVTYITAGKDPFIIPELGRAYQHIGWAEMADFPKTVAEIDIGLAPLRDTPWNRSRSYLKYLDYSALGVPGVYSDLIYRQVIRHRENGFLASSASDFVRLTGQLIESETLRQTIGTAARADVLAKHTLATNAHKWQAAYRETLFRRLLRVA